ncbi:MAG: hypothetical protein ACO3JL_18355, partial [Myxococcota bacterium]
MSHCFGLMGAMPEPSSSASQNLAPSPRSVHGKSPAAFRQPNLGTGLKETPRGLLYCEFYPARVQVLRGAPDPRAFVKTPGGEDGPGAGRWLGLTSPDIAVGKL